MVWLGYCWHQRPSSASNQLWTYTRAILSGKQAFLFREWHVGVCHLCLVSIQQQGTLIYPDKQPCTYLRLAPSLCSLLVQIQPGWVSQSSWSVFSCPEVISRFFSFTQLSHLERKMQCSSPSWLSTRSQGIFTQSFNRTCNINPTWLVTGDLLLLRLRHKRPFPIHFHHIQL